MEIVDLVANVFQEASMHAAELRSGISFSLDPLHQQMTKLIVGMNRDLVMRSHEELVRKRQREEREHDEKLEADRRRNEQNRIANIRANAKALHSSLTNPVEWRMEACCGKYHVLFPTVDQMWGNHEPFHLRLGLERMDHGERVLVGRFGFGIIDGVLRARSTKLSAKQPDTTFQWWGRETGTGEIQLGMRRGELNFLSSTEIEGSFQSDSFSGPFTAVMISRSTAQEMWMDIEGSMFDHEDHARESISRWR
jgi:hypothetical protein